MCEKCEVLDRKIEHYKLLLLTVNAKSKADGLIVLIARHQAAKQALHTDAQVGRSE